MGWSKTTSLIHSFNSEILLPLFRILLYEKDIHSAFMELFECRTGNDYFLSHTSKILDNDVAAIIEEASLVGAFWTDRQ